MVAAIKPGRRTLDGPVHFSLLKSMSSSPMHYKHAVENDRAETLALRLGRAVDALLFGTCGVVGFDGARRGPEWKAFAEANAGAICLNKTELAQVRGMAATLEANDEAMRLLAAGERQRTLKWKIGGRQCEGTPDVFTKDNLVELKTCRSSHPMRFVWDGRRMAYHAQLAWYREALLQCGLASPAFTYIVAVESKAPHPVTVFELTDRALDEGNRTWRLWFERLRASEESDAWPPYAESIVPFDVPEEESGFSLRIGGEEVEIE
jgi:hypothetical protein